MRANTIMASLSALLLTVAMGCSTNKANTPDAKDQGAKAMDNAGYKDVKVAVNNDKQLVTLTGDVKSQEEKDRAEELAKTTAAGFVISDEIGVRPDGAESDAKKIDSNMDSAIEKDFKAVIIA